MNGYWICTDCGAGLEGEENEYDVCMNCGGSLEFFDTEELARVAYRAYKEAKKEAAWQRGRQWAEVSSPTPATPPATPPATASSGVGPSDMPKEQQSAAETPPLTLDEVCVGILYLLNDEQWRSASAMERDMKFPCRANRHTIGKRLKDLAALGLVEGNGRTEGPTAAWGITALGKIRAAKIQKRPTVTRQ